MSVNNRLTNLEKSVHRLEKLASAPRQQNNDPPRDQSQANQKDNGTEPELAILPHVTPSRQNPKASKKKWYKAFGWWIFRFIWRFRFLEGVGIIAVVIYTGLTWFQWHDLRQNFRVDQRAWLKVSYIYPAVGIPVNGIDVQVTNVGKSPALDTFINVVYEVPENTKPPSFDYTQPHIQVYSRALLFTTEADTFAAKPYIAIDDTQVKAFTEGKLYMVVFGQITYSDQFGKHWTRFCTWKDYADSAHNSATYLARSCTLYNRAGDGDPPK